MEDIDDLADFGMVQVLGLGHGLVEISSQKVLA